MKERNNQNDQSKQVVLTILAVVVLLIGVVGVSLAVFQYAGRGTRLNTVTTGKVVMSYTEDTNGISIVNAQPMSDDAGKAIAVIDNNVFDFTVSAQLGDGASVQYEVAAIKDGTSTLANDEVKLYLQESSDGLSYSEVTEPKVYTPLESASATGAPRGAMTLASGTFTRSETKKYRLRMWVAQGTSVSADVEKKFTVTVDVYGMAA